MKQTPSQQTVASEPENSMDRRDFLARSGAIAAGTLLTNPFSILWSKTPQSGKMRVALVGTGVRGTSMWGKDVVDQYSDRVEFVGLCDINPGRLQLAKEYMRVNCPTFTNFDEMMQKTRPDTVIVTTVDATHDYFITRAMELGANVITEKPLTTDEVKCQRILDTERRTGKKVIVTFNYRYTPLTTRIKELLAGERIGKIISVDFHWYLNIHHGASYFRRWHGFRDKSGTLLVHKATHHFDLLNWWIDSDPAQVFGWGDLEHYGRNHPFRHTNCRTCPHTKECQFYWDITKSAHDMKLYVENEKYDGYIRDACVWRKEIDIFDKMAVQIKYANNVFVSYSLTTYSPYEGWRVAFNGTKGRIDSWEDIPWLEKSSASLSQQEKHEQEMQQNSNETQKSYNEIVVSDNFGDYEVIQVPKYTSGHGGGDSRLKDQIFKNPDAPDPLKHAAGTRDGAMSILVGIAARESIYSGEPVSVANLTDLVPRPKRL